MKVVLACALVALVVAVVLGTYWGSGPSPARAPTSGVQQLGAAGQVKPRVSPRAARQAEPARESRNVAYVKQDAELARVLAEPKRWKLLPESVAEVYLDGSHRAWFTGASPGAEDHGKEFRGSIERAAAGDPVMLRGGRVVLVDRAGRIWAFRSDSYNQGHLLHGYDSASKQWLEPRQATGPRQNPRGDEPMTSLGHWADPSLGAAAFEDSAGDLHFFGGSTVRTGPGAAHGFGVHRRAADGTWSFFKLEDGNAAEELLRRRAYFVEQPGRRLTVCPAASYDSPNECRVLHFDGTAWSSMKPCPYPDRFSTVYAVVPLMDGSVAALLDGRRLLADWPSGALPQRTLEDLVEGLEHPDAAEREKASQSLVAKGPGALPQLRKLRQAASSPEAARRFDDVLRALEALDNGPGEREDDGAAAKHTPDLHGGRFLFGSCYFTSRRADGQARFYVEDCLDRRTDKRYPQAFITVAADGTWDVSAVPMAQWKRVGFSRLPEGHFEDSTGGVWLGGVLRTDPKNELVPAAPDGLSFKDADLLFEDRDGRIYFRAAGRYYVYDPSDPEKAPDLPAEYVLQSHAVYYLMPQREGWAADYTQWPPRLVHIDAGGNVRAIAPNWGKVGFLALVPLRGGALVRLGWNEQDEPPETRFMLWDGKVWQGADEFKDLVHANAGTLARMAGSSFLAYGMYGDVYRLAADGRGGLWSAGNDRPAVPPPGARAGEIRSDQPVSTFEYFDGAKWHDAWDAVGGPGRDTRIIRSVERGGAVLVETRRSIQLVRFADGELRFSTLDNPGTGPGRAPDWGTHFVDGAEGEWWVHLEQKKRGDPTLYVYRHGEFRPEEKPDGFPLLYDRDGRFWSMDQAGKTLRVKSGDAWGEATIAGLIPGASLSQSPDGRLWLLHGEAISEIGLDASQSPPAIREVGRWNWNSVRNAFPLVFHDDAGRMWLMGNASRFSRFKLPPPAVRGG